MITVRGLTKHFGARRQRRLVLAGADAIFEERQTYVIFGGRRSGKTTLLRLLCGLQVPTAGVVKRRGSVVIPPGGARVIDPNKTGREMATFLSHLYGANPREVAEFVSEFAGLGREMQQSVARFTPEQRTKYGFALSYALPGSYYLFDETIAYGDPRFTDRCIDAFERRRQSAGVIIAAREVRAWPQLDARGGILLNGKLYMYDSVGEAAEHYRELELSNSEAGLPMAKALLKAGQIQRAEEHLGAFMEDKDPGDDDVEAYLLLANLRIGSGRLPEARSAAMSALEHDARSPDSWFLLARLSQLEGRLEAAMAEALRVLQVAPDHKEAAVLLAKCYDALGMAAEAAEVWRGMADASGNRSFLHQALSRYEKAGKWDRVVDAVADIDPKTDSDLRILELRARSLLALGRSAEAVESIRDLARIDMGKVVAELYKLTKSDLWPTIIPVLTETWDLDWGGQAQTRNVQYLLAFLERRLADTPAENASPPRASLEAAIAVLTAPGD